MVRRFILTLLLTCACAGVAPAHEDTAGENAVSRLNLPDSFPLPTAVHIFPDTVSFGGQALVAVDFPVGTELPPISDLSLTGDGVVLVPADRIVPPEDAFPPTSDTRLLLSIRSYVLGDFQVAAGDFLTPPVNVRGRVQDSAETAPVRGPRVWGLPLYLPVGLAIALLLLAWLVWWIWRRRRRPAPLTQWVVAPPAWLQAAVDLEDLLRSGTLDRGETRPFLDQLAGIIRRFVAGRYRVPAAGATGVDVLRACADLGHLPEHPRSFARLIDSIDTLRYGPEPASEGQCREGAGEFLLSMDAVRILPRFTPVAVEDILSAEQAWSRLQGIPWLGATVDRSAPEVV